MLRCSVRVFDRLYPAAALEMRSLKAFPSLAQKWLAGRGSTMKPVYDHLVSAEARSRWAVLRNSFRPA